MQAETHVTKSRKAWLAVRAPDLTSTTVPALFGASPHVSLFELWHHFHDKGALPELDLSDNDRVFWGETLQDSIAKGVAKREGWKLRRMREYIRFPALRLGSSFDFSIESDPLGVLEIKNVDGLQFKTGWVKDDDGAIEAPLHIEIQLATQMLVSGRSYGVIAALVGGNDVKLIRRERDETVCEAIRTKAGEFWASVEEHREPPPNFKVDGAFIAKLYGVDPHKLCDATGSSQMLALAENYDDARAQEKRFKEIKEAAKAEMLFLAKDSHAIMAPEFKVSCGIVKGGPRSYVVEDYRNFRLSMKG